MNAQDGFIEKNQKQQVLDSIQQMKDSVENNPGWEAEKRQEASDALSRIGDCVASGRAPSKTDFDDLMKAVGDNEDLTSQALQIVERFGYIPSL